MKLCPITKNECNDACKWYRQDKCGALIALEEIADALAKLGGVISRMPTR